MESHDYVVATAADGPKGIELAGKNNYDMILLDIQLPEMDGYAVAAALRNNIKTKDIPIVAVTSYAMVGDREKALASGCNGYIEKPINPETFISQIERFLPSA